LFCKRVENSIFSRIGLPEVVITNYVIANYPQKILAEEVSK